jgi:hypothetical protein
MSNYHFLRGGARISRMGVQPLKRGTHGGGAAPNSENLRAGGGGAAPQKNLKIQVLIMSFPGIWD